MTTAVLLLAGTGARLRPLTDDRPKCLVELRGKPLLQWQLDSLRAGGVSDVAAVTGHLHQRVEAWLGKGIDRVYHNPAYARTSIVASLFSAEAELHGDVVISYGDIIYSPAVVQALMRSAADISVVVDLAWRELWEARFADPLSDAETLVLDPDSRILEIGGKTRDTSRIMGQYIGLTKLTARGAAVLRDAHHAATNTTLAGGTVWGGVRDMSQVDMTRLLGGMIADGVRVDAVPIRGEWLEVDSLADYRMYSEMLAANPGAEVYGAGRGRGKFARGA